MRRGTLPAVEVQLARKSHPTAAAAARLRRQPTLQPNLFCPAVVRTGRLKRPFYRRRCHVSKVVVEEALEVLVPTEAVLRYVQADRHELGRPDLLREHGVRVPNVRGRETARRSAGAAAESAARGSGTDTDTAAEAEETTAGRSGAESAAAAKETTSAGARSGAADDADTGSSDTTQRACARSSQATQAAKPGAGHSQPHACRHARYPACSPRDCCRREGNSPQGDPDDIRH